MSTVQDRLKQSRTPLDKWSKREQLCLASAVSCSGDQNWMSVSRTMKLVCGTGVNSVSRPIDWYSQKSCAVQYGHLLENVETPKRKKRSSESSGNEGTTTVDTPTDIVLRKLSEERMLELKNEIRKNQEEYAKVYKEIKELQSGNCSEERLLAIWQEMEQEEEAKRKANIKVENEMREREQRKLELQRNWRATAPIVIVSAPKTETIASEVKEENVDKSKPPPLLELQPDSTQILQQQPQTSPLLSSLLKSPTSTAPPANQIQFTSIARSTAPTITTLLTGGSIPITKQPVVIIKNTDVGQMLTRPASGPPGESTSSAQNLLSPSQSAPTLSMLLEKNKTNNVKIITTESSDQNLVQVEPKMENKMETINANKEIAMEVDEELSAIDNNNMEVDDTDPNEEQQLLEVFKNIGNIELEIDAEFLTAMDEEPANENIDIGTGSGSGNFETKVENVNKMEIETKEKKVEEKIISNNNVTEEEDNIKTVESKELSTVEELQSMKSENTEISLKCELIKSENSSSDDSSDNIPLATVATVLETTVSKELSNTEVEDLKPPPSEEIETEKIEVSAKKEEKIVEEVEIKEEEPEESKEDEEEEEEVIELKENTSEIIEKVEENSIPLSDVKDEEKIEVVEEKKSEEIVEVNSEETKLNKKIEIKTTTTPKNAESAKEEIKPSLSELTKTQKVEETPIQKDIIPITDTDTDSSCTPEVEKLCNLDQKPPAPRERIKTERLMSEDSDSTILPLTPTLPPTVTPARPPALRKLRERDRSESPMIGEDDTEHNSSTTSRLRRRASSTPLIDSVPNSPASVSDREDRELRTASKKSLMTFLKGMQQKYSKQITLLEQSFSEGTGSNGAKYELVCLRPMDFQVIQQNIESGKIRSTIELQRDILLMCQNAIMLYALNTDQHRAALQIKEDCHNLSDLCQFDKIATNEKESKEKEFKANTSTISNNPTTTPISIGIKSRSGFRKSQRIS